MSKKSLSASLGAWYIHLIYNPQGGKPDGADRRSNLALLYLPPYLAILLGIGAGMQALAHFITLGNLTGYLLSALVFSVVISYGARVGTGPLQRLCAGMRWPFVLVLLFLAISSRSSSLLPPESEGEGNSVVAVLVGLTTILSVLLVGARSGGRTVPLSAPLVPGLSLFGLLSLVSVDTIVQICFLLFVASALYIMAYERFMRRYVREDDTDPVPRHLPPFPSMMTLARWSAGALLVCSVWFALFMVGGAVLYYPVQAILPRLISPQLSKMRAAAQGSLMDYRGSSSVMELRGGTYVLSDREVLRITVQKGESSGLWRGRVYEHYQRSRWLEADTAPGSNFTSESATFGMANFGMRRRPVMVKPPPIDPNLGDYRDVIERVEPMDSISNSVYASGLIISRHDTDEVSPDFGDGSDFMRQQRPYIVLSKVIAPRLNRLSNAPGLSHAQLKSYPTDSPVKAALVAPDDSETHKTVSAIAQQIKLAVRGRCDTPYDKVRAISDYLIQNCTYSLHSAPVPPSRDAVVFFLTDSHAGACDMFASSMALLLREMGVPARIATGYLQPDSTPQNRKGGTERPTWIVRERDAHAWVEYFVPGLGWLSYDPTLGTRTADDSFSGQIAEFLALPSISVPWHMLALPGAGLALLLVGAVWSYVEKHGSVRVSASADEVGRARIGKAYREAVALLSKRVPYQAHFTLHEYDDRVSRSTVPVTAKQEFAALTLLQSSAQYQEHPPSVVEAELAGSLTRLRNGLRQRKH